MDNNTTPTPKKRKSAWLYTLFTLLVFAPTVIIIIILMSDGAKGALPNNDESRDTADESDTEIEPLSVTEKYLGLTANSILVGELPDEYADSAYIDIQMGINNYKFYFSEDGNKAYYVLNSTSVYAVDARALSEFRASDALPDVSVRPPVLYFNGSAVIPSSSEYFYMLGSGAKVSLSYDRQAPTERLISKNSSLYFSFDLSPDECAVTLYSGDKTVFSGDLKALAERFFEGNEQLYCRINAKWNERPGSLCGSATYNFAVELNGGISNDSEPAETEPVAEPFECFLDADTVSVGEYTVVKMINVTDPESIELRVPSEAVASEVFELDGAYYALIATPLDAPADTYSVSIKHADKIKTLQYTVSARVCKERKYDASDLLIKLTRTQTSLDEYRNVIDTLSALHSQCEPASDALEDSEATIYRDSNIYLGFGHYRTLSDGTRYQMDGVDFKVTEGEPVPAIASGTVVYAGYSQYLGNYTVIDHGAGIKTYYAHLSALKCSEGDAVRAGDTVGCAGKTGFTSTSGVYLMCTVNGVVVSPYKMLEGGIIGINFSDIK